MYICTKIKELFFLSYVKMSIYLDLHLTLTLFPSICLYFAGELGECFICCYTCKQWIYTQVQRDTHLERSERGLEALTPPPRFK